MSDSEHNSSLGPLAGLKVIDVSTVIAGPHMAMLLADFGADVLKIEHPRGDPCGPPDIKKTVLACGGKWRIATNVASPST